MLNHSPHVVYLSYDGLTDPLGQSQILPYLLGLEANGFRFTVLSFEKKEALLKEGKTVDQKLEGKRITWIPLRYTRKPPVLSTVTNIYVLYRAVLKIQKRRSIDLLHCRSYVTSLVGLYIKRKSGLRFLFDMRGFWADERVEGNIWNLSNPIYRTIYNFFKKKERAFWHESDHIISLTENAKKEMASQAVSTPITVIPTCADLSHFSVKALPDNNKTEQRQALGIPENAFVLVYSGSWGTWYLTEDMLQFFQLIHQVEPNARFLIISPDQVLIPQSLANRIIHKKATRSEMPSLLGCANASVFFIKPSFSKKASSATKLGELLAMQLPVVTNTGWGDIQTYQGNGVMVLENLTSQNLQAGVQWIISAQPDWPNAHLEKLSLAHGVEQYTHVYKIMLDKA